jgi:hypothetical protein
MVLDVSVVLTWILFLALFPVGYFWMRRAYRIFVKKDYSEVALKRGESPANPKKWAPFAGIINLAAGLAAFWTIAGVLFLGYPYETWSAIAGSTLWSKILADFLLRQQAHPFIFGRKKSEASAG